MVIGTVLVILIALGPIAYFYWRQYKVNTPSLQWPALAEVLKMDYAAKPPRISGQWNGRAVRIELKDSSVLVSALVSRPSRLRIEIGPKEQVAARAGVVVPDPVPTHDPDFDGRYLARCNDRAVGQRLVDPVLRQRLLEQPVVDILGEGQAARWRLPEAKDPDQLEPVLDIVTIIADEMERYA
ncbi:MAG: hypothetical protein HY549_10270 [Elusimicrobia bacterium]|nr:hypothetical protein [Elusimicrobiota bacterium]